MAFFLEMAWKSALIAGAALALAAALRGRAASDRATVLRVGAALLIALPFLSIWSPALEIAAWSAPAPAAAAVPMSAGTAAALAAMPMAASQPTIWDDPTPLVLIAYLGGLLMVGGRLFAGLWTLGRWTRAARPVACPEWLAAFDRVRWTAPQAERIRLLVSDEARAPLSWGWLRPAILIDPDTLDQPDEAEAILAHEVAHVARGDWPALMVSRAAAALFWFNPLVWLLEREIVQQAEEAADAEVVDRVEPARYARTLVAWAQAGGERLPAHAIAPSARALARRVKAILDGSARERPAGSAWTAAAILACIGIAAPVAALELVEARAPRAPAAPAAPEAPLAPAAPLAVAAVAAPAAPDAPLPPEAADEIDAALDAVLPEIPAIVASAMASLDPDEIARTVEHSLTAVRVNGQPIARAEIEAAMAEARAEIAEARAEFSAEHRAEMARAVAEARAEIRRIDRDELRRLRVDARRHARTALSEGAAGMEQGAREMERQAARFNDRAERERIIAKERAKGRTVTHEQLIEAAADLAEGAAEMRESAREMREQSREARNGS